MPEYFALVEMEPSQTDTMPRMPSYRSVQFHAATDGHDGAVQVACDYTVVADRDLPKRDMDFSRTITPRLLDAPRCAACEFEVDSAA